MNEELSPELQEKAKHWAAIVRLVTRQNPSLINGDLAAGSPGAVYYYIAFDLNNLTYKLCNVHAENFRMALARELGLQPAENSASEELSADLQEKAKQFAAIISLIRTQNPSVVDTSLECLVSNAVSYVSSISDEANNKSHGNAFKKALLAELNSTQDRSDREKAGNVLEQYAKQPKPSNNAGDVTEDKTRGQDNPLDKK